MVWVWVVLGMGGCCGVKMGAVGCRWMLWAQVGAVGCRWVLWGMGGCCGHGSLLRCAGG